MKYHTKQTSHLLSRKPWERYVLIVEHDSLGPFVYKTFLTERSARRTLAKVRHTMLSLAYWGASIHADTPTQCFLAPIARRDGTWISLQIHMAQDAVDETNKQAAQ